MGIPFVFTTNDAVDDFLCLLLYVVDPGVVIPHFGTIN